MVAGQIAFVVGAAIAGGLLTAWVRERRTRQRKKGGRRRH
jgi:hypothetical protein